MPAKGEPARAAAESLEALVTKSYDELRVIARRHFRQCRPGLTLRPTEIVDEACLHLIQHGRADWQGTEHFRAIATHKIWQVIVDELRRRRARKRGGPVRRPAGAAEEGDATADGRWRRIPLDAVVVDWYQRQIELLDLAEGLDALAVESPRPSEVVRLHWFGNMKYEDVARVLGVSASTVEKDFRYALAWLNRRLSGDQVRGD